MEISPKLIKDCMRSDRKAQFQLYKSCFSLLMGICRRYHSNENDAAAIMNQGFMKILTNIKKYRPEIPFEAWARKVMINTLIDEFRKTRKVKELMETVDFSEGQWEESGIFDWNHAEQAFDADQLKSYIHQLPPVSRKVFNLYAIDGYKHAEIAELLNISMGTSKWHLSFARKKLQEMLQKALNESKVS
jgi:RNA polymerase sigma factor (sigma-70 family)